MKYSLTLLAFAGAVLAEVPQEHSHQSILTAANTALQLNNPLKITDAVFALLGNAAAANGAPNVANLDCLQQIVADQAFTNAKAAGDVNAQANAIMFRALERNTGAVGLASVLCTQTAVNPEIAAISQHQDPASAGAAAINKAIALNVAKQLKAIGADPTLAIKTGTFAPGTIGDPTSRGNTCDTATDATGCIFTQNLLVPDVTVAEIDAAVGGVAAAAAAAPAIEASSVAANCTPVARRYADLDTRSRRYRGVHERRAAVADCPPAPCVESTDSNSTAAAAPAAAAPAAATTASAGVNVQTFTGSLGATAPAVIKSSGDRPFSVNGNTFVNAGAALQRSCAIQNNACADAANAKKITASVSDCNAQETACNAAASA